MNRWQSSQPLQAVTKGWLRLVRLRVWLSEHFAPSEWQITLFWAALVGVIGGLSSLTFREALSALHLLLTNSREEMVESFAHLEPWQRIVTPTLGGALTGVILIFGKRFAKKRSTTDYMEAIALGDGRISFRTSLVKSFAALCGIASGASIGREGPMVQLSSMFASLTGRWRKWPVTSLRLLVACGAAAGIASAYNAPIGGAFFVAEIVLGTIAMESLGPLVVSAVAATLVVRQLSDAHNLYEVPHFNFKSAWEIGPYLVVGLLCGTLAPLFLQTLRGAEKLFVKMRLPLVLQLTLGGVCVGLLAFRFPAVCGNGYSVTLAILHGEIVWSTLLLLVICKCLATASSFGSGVPGGVFTPTLFMGASVGFLIGTGFQHLWPNGNFDPQAFALVGMGAFLAAASHAPVMAIILLFEMTLSYDIILPLMLAATIAYFTAKSQMGESLYEEFLRRKAEHEPEARMPEISLGHLLRQGAPTVLPTATFQEICNAFVSTRINNLYVVDEQQRFLGVVSLHDIKPYLGQPEIAVGVLAMDILREEFPTISPDAGLPDALAVFGKHELERIPIVAGDGSRKLLGSLAKNDLLVALTDVRHQKESGAVQVSV
ncbi:MAG TPA: ClcB-like voltage-gated chloride channel protein [Opitutaceae bacterium]|nr:ClcB-like voltage-gated chloride channel protein [Opitutaceae bacterium]